MIIVRSTLDETLTLLLKEINGTLTLWGNRGFELNKQRWKGGKKKKKGSTSFLFSYLCITKNNKIEIA